MDGSGAEADKHVVVDKAVRDYVTAACTPPDPVIRMLAERTMSLGDAAGMMVPVEQASFLTILTRLVGARTAVDIGTFTGLSALALALGVNPGGRVVTCDVTDRWVEIAREHWERAGVADAIDFRLGPAARMLSGFAPETVDIVFIDADKMNYPHYYRLAVPLLRVGGLLVVDNVLLDGHVLHPERADPGLPRQCAETLRAFNATLAADARFDAVMLPVADGLSIARKREMLSS